MKRSPTIIATIFLSLMTIVTQAQDKKYVTAKTAHKKAVKAYQEGDLYSRRGDYTNAIKAFDKAIKKEPTFVKAYLLRADSYYALKQYQQAETDFEKILELAPDYDKRIYYVVGVTEAEQFKFEEAVEHIQQYLDTKPRNEKLVKKATKLMENFKFSAIAFKNPLPFNPENLGENINTPLAEYLPTITADGETLLFTRKVGNQEDFYITYKENGEWKRAEELGPPINTDENEGGETISADGRLLVYTACNRPNDYGSCDLYFSEFKNGNWTKPRNMGAPINSSGWESQPSLSADGKTLYFTSSRKGGYDIYKSKRLPNGKWTKPEYLTVNTSSREEGPFIHPDGETLYFVSSGYPGIGNMDLYFSKLQADGTWGEPKNLGYPINTKANEGPLVISLDGKTAYFSSTKKGGYGRVDLYQFEMPEAIRPNPVTYAIAKVYDAETRLPIKKANVEVLNLETSQVQTESDTDEEGEFLVCLPMGKDYALNVNKTGYIFHSENFALKAVNSREEPFVLKIYLQKLPPKPVDVVVEKPTVVSKPVVLKNVFFKSGSATLENASKVELNKLSDFLKENATVNIQINGHTDDVGEEGDNQKLSENRAKSVVEYLISVGIQQNRLLYKGFGESKPVATNETKEGRQLNRRTEFVILNK